MNTPEVEGPRSNTAKVLGPWVAVEPLYRVEHHGLALPGTRRADDVFPAFVLALGDEVGTLPDGERVDPPFGPGDVVLCEMMCGHPYMSGNPPPQRRSDGRIVMGETRPVLMRCSTFGGTYANPVGLVPWYPVPLSPCQRDEEGERRARRYAYIEAYVKAHQKTLEAEEGRHLMMEKGAHAKWLEDYDKEREGRRRTKYQKHTFDNAVGEGIVAVLPTVEAVLAMGVDADHLYRLLKAFAIPSL